MLHLRILCHLYHKNEVITGCFSKCLRIHIKLWQNENMCLFTECSPMLFALSHVPERLCLRKWLTLTLITNSVFFHQQLPFLGAVLVAILLWKAVRTWCQEIIP